MKFIPEQNQHQRQGVALIAVLGLLSVMILLGITFAISMRTSRMSTENYSYMVQARQLVHAAIAGTMTNLNDKLNGEIYPSWDVEKSEGGSPITGSVFFAASDLAYIPNSLQGFAQTEAGSATWLNITDLSGSKVIGRFAYLAVNNSGLLDINNANYLPRNYGTNVNEIQLNGMSEITDANQFSTQRLSTWGRFETLAELQQLNIQGLQNDLDTLFIYSRMPPGYLDAGVAETSIVIRTVADILANETAIKDKLSGIVGADTDRIFNSLIDYVDADPLPQDPLGFATETHPLINEISISNQITTVGIGPPATYQNQWQIDVELFYPFNLPINIPANSLEVQVSITANGGGTKFNGIGTTPVGGSPFWNTNTPIRLLSPPITIAGSDDVSSTASDLDITITLKLAGPGGDILDQVQTFNVPYGSLASIPLPVIGANSSPPATPILREVNDPRINWSWDDHWVDTGPSLNSMNVGATFDSDPDADGSWIVHVANSNLYSVGELGHLLYNSENPWQTIRFLNPDPDRTAQVLDWFTVETNSTGRGKINLNSTETDVLAAVFEGLNVRRWFGDDSPIPSASVDSSSLATAIRSPVANVLTNLSELPNKLTETEVINALGGGVDPAYAEGVIRDSLGLIGVRQNMFTIFGLVQSGFEQTPGDPDTFVDLAEQKFVTVIWRDPYPDALGRHQVITRFFKWMTD